MSGGSGVLVKDGRLYVTVGAILDYWRAEMKGHERLTARKVSMALKGLVVGGKASKNKNGLNEIDISMLVREAETYGWMNDALNRLVALSAVKAGTNGNGVHSTALAPMKVGT